MIDKTDWETKAIVSIKKHEGCELKLYKCPAGKNTIGYGHNLDANRIPQEAAEIILKADFEEVLRQALNFFDAKIFNNFPDAVKVVIVDMMFNLGLTGFSKFKKMIACIIKGDYKKAAAEGRDSLWYKQVTNRAEELMKMLERTE